MRATADVFVALCCVRARLAIGGVSLRPSAGNASKPMTVGSCGFAPRDSPGTLDFYRTAAQHHIYITTVLTCDIDIGILFVRRVPVLYRKDLTYCHSFVTAR